MSTGSGRIVRAAAGCAEERPAGSRARTFGISALIWTNAELRAAREEVAALAVARERARLGRDLHDVLGHSLTAIKLKVGLARKMVANLPDVEGRDPIVRELRSVENSPGTRCRRSARPCRTTARPRWPPS
ncbi:histidine kinase [Amycolatopsis alkalitolerans]|uniref:histidine kinase n=1 Tax=Amycolatopsis alkalitolerans TaxID=2547244 RepID=UPI00135757BB|nr:histidine kinase dimerization/phosphoacceptor domain-containing protein [Amycolatopsis alkalitolerans]